MPLEDIYVNVSLGRRFNGDRPCVEISVVRGNKKWGFQLGKDELEDLRRALYLAAKDADRWKFTPFHYRH